MADLKTEIKFVYNSNRLDGVHIGYDTTRELIESPPDPLEESVDIPSIEGGKSFFRHHVLSHHMALGWLPTLSEEPQLTEEHICGLHRRLMANVILSNGEYRECSLRYRAIPPVPPEQISARMKRVLAIMNLGFQRARDKSILAWQVHHEFIYVHPFIEGNGRMARLLLNLMRIRAGFDIEVVPYAEAKRYLASIQAYGQKLAAAKR